ncbi:NmrA family protein [Sporothrix brasiliensis 5110]|uniref:NmrA family protein n=1 Tax=Sporothrix brasiliensis 5110 TaxID=1398154 RepID=A0A0C2INH9_9PEZI|nr:NmrA family protein [Sporothrix brasiliensis 5110]KIH90591.1 NmrA family protein [Sporothrix brasiliensis 5110]
MADGILVLGAGELGIAVLEALARHPKRSDTKIAVLLRGSSSAADPARAQLLRHLQDDLHVHFETADVVSASVADLAAVFGRYHTVVSCNGMGLPAGTQTKLSQAALQARVPRYVPWQFGMDYDAIGAGSTQDLFDEQLAVRALLRSPDNTTTDWIIVSTGLFMSFLFLAAFGVVDRPQRTVRGLGQWDNRITVTTPADIGTVTADILLDPQGIQRQVVYVAGDTVSYGDVADLLDAHYATTFKRELWDLGALQQQVAARPDDTMVKYRDTFAQGRGVAWDKDITVNAQRHIPMTDVQQYIQGLDKL